MNCWRARTLSNYSAPILRFPSYRNVAPGRKPLKKSACSGPHSCSSMFKCRAAMASQRWRRREWMFLFAVVFVTAYDQYAIKAFEGSTIS